MASLIMQIYSLIVYMRNVLAIHIHLVHNLLLARGFLCKFPYNMNLDWSALNHVIVRVAVVLFANYTLAFKSL